MNITINLLPLELKKSRIQDQRKALIVKTSITILALMILLTGVQIVLVILNNKQVEEANMQLDASKLKVNSLKSQESLAFVLKSRLESISKLNTQGMEKVNAFNQLMPLIPKDAKVLSLNVNSDHIVFDGEVPNTKALNQLFNNLTDPTINEGKITGVKLENFNKNASSNLQFSLKIFMAKSS